jgi:hypothetical protein
VLLKKYLSLLDVFLQNYNLGFTIEDATTKIENIVVATPIAAYSKCFWIDEIKNAIRNIRNLLETT